MVDLTDEIITFRCKPHFIGRLFLSVCSVEKGFAYNRQSAAKTNRKQSGNDNHKQFATFRKYKFIFEC